MKNAKFKLLRGVLSFLVMVFTIGSLFGETVVFSGRIQSKKSDQYEVRLLLNPPKAQVFVRGISGNAIVDQSLTFDGSNLYDLHDNWPNRESKEKDIDRVQFAEVFADALPPRGGNNLVHALWLPAISQCQPNLVLANLNFLRPRHLPEDSLNIRQTEAEDKLKFEGWGPPTLVLRRNEFSKSFDYSEKFPEGIKAFDLEVSPREFINAPELNFRYREYFPKLNDEDRKYGTSTLLGVLVRDQNHESEAITPPPLLSETTIFDARFVDEMPEGLKAFITYKPKNNQWLPADDAVVQTNFFEVKKAVERKHAARWHGIIFFFLLTALICGPVIAEWFINKRKTNRAKRN